MTAETTPNLNELVRLSWVLSTLLADPHPGLYTWNVALYNTIKKIAAFAEAAPAEKK